MKKIKFRVFSKGTSNNPNFNKFGQMFDVDDLILQKYYPGVRIFDSEDFIVQQFTGLKDVNGVDIYEGDIVEYTQHMFNTDAVRTERKEIKWIEYLASFNVYETAAGQSGHKVVGNIFMDYKALERV